MFLDEKIVKLSGSTDVVLSVLGSGDDLLNHPLGFQGEVVHSRWYLDHERRIGTW